jgi:methanogenic corrinoid protein MtbC1
MVAALRESQLEDMERALLSLDRVMVSRLLAEGSTLGSPLSQVETLIVPVLESIGTKWEEGQLSLSQVYMSGRLCEELVDAILPPSDSTRKAVPPMAIAALEDYHMLGLRIVYSALRASGFSLQNYGRMETDQLVARVKADGIRILLVSVLMLPSALRIRQLRERLEAAGCRPKLIVGGAPFRFDEHLWQEVGADAVGSTASEAIAAVMRVSREMTP